ncbi:hypothetical protein GEMRC1_007147 [Eukaryota sp. GEM-RC1]
MLDQYYQHKRRVPLQPKPKKFRRTTASTSLNSSDHINAAIVSNPYKNTISSLPSLTASKATYPRDVLVSETFITKPLSTQFNDILSVFDALTSVFVSLGSKPGTSITWDELQSCCSIPAEPPESGFYTEYFQEYCWTFSWKFPSFLHQLSSCFNFYFNF